MLRQATVWLGNSVHHFWRLSCCSEETFLTYKCILTTAIGTFIRKKVGANHKAVMQHMMGAGVVVTHELELGHKKVVLCAVFAFSVAVSPSASVAEMNCM